jgi:DNA-directed RNA polymerase specialized sigma24 family protein
VETLDTSSPVPADETGETAVAALFQARYLDMVRLAVLLGADDAEDIAQEAFARLLTRHVPLRDPGAALAYVRSTVCNLTRKRWRHSLVVRSRTPAMPDEASPEHTAILREDHREVLAALAALPARSCNGRVRRDRQVATEQGHGKCSAGPCPAKNRA